MNEMAICTNNLSRTFGTVQAVDSISLEVEAGTLFGFLGPNGAGKTTTIRLLLGLLEPTQGNAQVLGFDTRRQAGDIRQHCGALLEHNGIYEKLSAEDNLEFYGRIWRIPTRERKNRIKEILTQMGLWERRQEMAGTWSRGMKQKLAIARVLLHRPDLVFLDEPTAGLDPVAAAALREDLATLAEQEGVTVFLTTHNLSEAEKLCSKVAVIRKGKLLSCGKPNELLKQGGTSRILIQGRFPPGSLDVLKNQPDLTGFEVRNNCLTLEQRSGAETAPLISALVSAGAEVEEVRKEAASLEEVFLNLVEEER